MAIAYRPGAIDFRYGRPSRRQSVMGHGLGHPVLPAMQRPVPNVGIAIDTSGSMSAEDLTLAVSEAKGILEAVGAELTFIACDAEVRAIKVVNDTSSLVRSLVGGGGTDFNPVFKAVQTIRPRPEVLIFATDGWGPAPDKPPRGIRVVWLLIGEQGRPPEFPGEPWGEMVKVEESEKDGEDKAA